MRTLPDLQNRHVLGWVPTSFQGAGTQLASSHSKNLLCSRSWIHFINVHRDSLKVEAVACEQAEPSCG